MPENDGDAFPVGETDDLAPTAKLTSTANRITRIVVKSFFAHYLKLVAVRCVDLLGSTLLNWRLRCVVIHERGLTPEKWPPPCVSWPRRLPEEEVSASRNLFEHHAGRQLVESTPASSRAPYKSD